MNETHDPKWISIPTEVLPINANTIYTVFAGNIDSMTAMIHQYLKVSSKDMNQLKNTILENIEESTQKMLHYFKGPLSYFGADRLIYLIDKIQNKILLGFKLTLVEINQLEYEFESFLNSLKKIAKEISMNGNKHTQI
jgi:HPt (histidine-containing phosphotransfer) domain-containing protein